MCSIMAAIGPHPDVGDEEQNLGGQPGVDERKLVHDRHQHKRSGEQNAVDRVAEVSEWRGHRPFGPENVAGDGADKEEQSAEADRRDVDGADFKIEGFHVRLSTSPSPATFEAGALRSLGRIANLGRMRGIGGGPKSSPKSGSLIPLEPSPRQVFSAVRVERTPA